MTYLMLNFGNSLLELTMTIAGYKTVSFMNHPLLLSASPTGCWARRWNRVVQGLLKRAIFKPIRKISGSRWIAVAGTFLMSGLLHEYASTVMFYEYTDDSIVSFNDQLSRVYNPTMGKMMIFFSANGFILFLEEAIGGFTLFQWISRTFPTPVISLLVVAIVLPISHLFTADWIHGGHFSDFSLALPLIVHVKE
mmetsp:Transcript_2273/g.4136  ORF Transcript_2273/g.4136 Transcript_2273/m.4136 type:complete len:194 (-) Transcript_2273:6-587(-)